MLVYVTALLLTILFSKIYIDRYVYNDGRKTKKTNKSIKIIFFLLACFPLWFVTAFRYDVGTDYFFTYVKYFEDVKLGWRPYENEPLFMLLNEILVKLNLSVVWLFAISGAIIIIYTFKICFTYSDNPVLSIVLFVFSSFFFASLNNVRQYVGLVLAIWGVLIHNKPFKSLVYIIIGGLFHLSNFVFLLFLLIFKVKLSKKNYLITTCVAVILTPLFAVVLVELLKYTRYSYFTFSGGGYSLLFVLLNIFIYIISYIYYDEKDEAYRKYALLQLITLVLCVLSVFLNNEEFFMRITRITAFTQILLLPKIIKRASSSRKKILLLVLILCAYAVYTGYTVVWMGGLEVLPYQFVF